jgi:hypothetical protein
VLRVEDNGAGFPPAMLKYGQEVEPDCDEGFARGRTQLGLYFSAQIAHLHCTRERVGMVRLENGHDLTGGCFSLWLP